jgi:hypothetical protein
MEDPQSLDIRVRAHVYDITMRTGAPPTSAEVARAMSLSGETVLGAFHRLADAHVLVLKPDTGEVLMANPFSAVPTPFLVETEKLRRLRRIGRDHRLRRRREGRWHPALRDSGSQLVERHRLHVKDDALLPVGRARDSMVRSMALPARRNLVAGNRMEAGARVVLARAAKKGLASQNGRRSRVVVRAAWTHVAILEPSIRWSPSSSSSN